MPIVDATHLCPRCDQTKSLTEFAGRKNKQGLPYPSSYCRPCQADYNREWRLKNGADQLAKRKAKYRADPEFRAAVKEASARRYAADPDTQRDQRLLKEFGITLVQYRAMAEAQGYLCAICGETCKTGRSLAVDHDHETGRVRGLLCARCNNGLGNFCDNVDSLRRAIAYLTAPLT